MKIERHNRLNPQEIFIDETIFTTQNRYLGIRGCFEEDLTDSHNTMRGAYINGLYDTHTILYEEKAHGFAERAESMVNITDAQGIYITVDHVTLSPQHCEIIDLKRTYHLDKGYTERKICYQTPKGDRFTLTYKRIVHLKHKELFMIDATVTSETYEGPVTITSTLNGNVENYQDPNDPRLATAHAKKLNISAIETADKYGVLVAETKHTKFNIYTLMTHNKAFTYQKDVHRVIAQKTVTLKKDKPYSFRKYALYFNTLDHEQPKSEAIDLYNQLKDIDVYQTQSEIINGFWEFSKVMIEDKNRPFLNATIHYNLFQLYTSGGANRRTNIPAKGLSGEGYEGHAFWDTEIYMIPYFMQVDPSIAATLLNNRYSQMTEAKEEARRVGVTKGIKFAWRTISGRETSAYFPAGQAQFHINSDIAYAFIKNYQLHKDTSYFITYGLPVLIETSRFYSEIVTKKGRHYHIHNVTGPDEYTTLVNNNYYTNSMLKFQLEFMLQFLKDNEEACQSLIGSYELTDEEIDYYQDIAKHIYLPYDESLGIDAQDDSFLQKAKWHFETTKATEYPLLLHYHPISIYRQQVLKQPDTVLAHYLLNNRPFEVMDRSFGYYEPLTTHDSSLSRCIHAAQAARLGKIEKAYRYFLETVSLDLDNVQGNTEYGLHVANLGGMYIALLNGFLGFTVTDSICIRPTIPKEITSLSMKIRVKKDYIITVHVTHDTVKLSVNKPVTLTVYDKEVTIDNETIEVPYQE